MYISREEFLKQQAEKQERTTAFQNAGPRINYFALKDDGDEAVVRFCYDNPDQFDIITTHPVTVDGKFRRVNCLRESFKDSVDTCPMCAAKVPVQQKFYIKLIQYDRDENDQIVATPKIWERPTSYVNIIGNLFTEYGDVSDNVFKVKRSGKVGDKQTTYSIMLANPVKYNAELYPKNNNAFEGYNILGTAVLDKSFDELKEMAGDKVEETPAPVEQTSAPRKVQYY